MRLSVIIPTLNAGDRFKALLDRLAVQSLRADEIIVIDSSSDDDTVAIAHQAGCRVEVIDRSEFGHGRTRNRAAEIAEGDVLVFMTQDAMPCDERFLDHLTRPIREAAAAATYARQIAPPEATPLETFGRDFNYPAVGEVRTSADVPRMGIKAFFLSNVAAAYDRKAWDEAGRFDDSVIMNEDMLLCARLLRSGRAVAYQADAAVYHGHDYTLGEQFRRYFDIGVFFNQSRGALGGARAGGAGLRFARKQLVYLSARGRRRWLPRACAEVALKFLAVHSGKHYRQLPRRLRRWLSLHRRFWDRRP